MKHVILSDVHANWPALQSVYDAEPDADKFVVLGDLIGLGGFPKEVVESVKSNAEHVLKGNHDVSVIENQQGHVNSQELSQFELRTTQDMLDGEDKEWISSLSSYKTTDSPSSIMAHAEPYPELSSGIESSGVRKGSYTKAASNVDSEEYDYVFLGHTHDQAKLDCSDFGHNVTVVNPGSVGQPVNSGEAHYAVLNTRTGQVKLKKSEYNKETVFERLEHLDVPTKWWEKSTSRRRRRRR